MKVNKETFIETFIETGADDSLPVWPDWHFLKFWAAIFLTKVSQIFGDCFGDWKTTLLSKNCFGYLLGNSWKHLGYFFIPTSSHTVYKSAIQFILNDCEKYSASANVANAAFFHLIIYCLFNIQYNLTWIRSVKLTVK